MLRMSVTCCISSRSVHRLGPNHGHGTRGCEALGEGEYPPAPNQKKIWSFMENSSFSSSQGRVVVVVQAHTSDVDQMCSPLHPSYNLRALFVNI